MCLTWVYLNITQVTHGTTTHEEVQNLDALIYVVIHPRAPLKYKFTKHKNRKNVELKLHEICNPTIKGKFEYILWMQHNNNTGIERETKGIEKFP